MHLTPFIAGLKAHHLALLITSARVFFSGLTQSSSNKSGHEKQNGFCSLPGVKFGIQSLVYFCLKAFLGPFLLSRRTWFWWRLIIGGRLVWFAEKHLPKGTIGRRRRRRRRGWEGGNCRYLLACKQALYYRSVVRGLGRGRFGSSPPSSSYIHLRLT